MKEASSKFKVQSSKLAESRLAAAGRGLPSAFCRLLSADCRLLSADCRLPTAFCRLPTAVCLLLSACWFCLAGCGYHLGGKGAQIPADIKVIAVPAFRNETSRYKIEQALTQAVVRELLARTRFRVQPQAAGSDAVLTGSVIQFWSAPVVVESTGGRTTAVNINVRMRVTLTDNRTGKVLFQNPDYTFSETYEISGDASTYFEESAPAVARLSRTFAASLVSSLLEAF